MLEKTMRINYLVDFYQSLLTPKQYDYMRLYYDEDLSLVEIADLLDVSRQAVYDNLKRTEMILEDYEEKLKLYDKFLKRAELIEQLEAEIDQKEKHEKINDIIVQLKDLS
ncbi:putative DNA-binding protein [Ornithinibacillus sp. 4-3]|uniref:UPF0122 protein AB4Y30_07120 n=1 Tax=Ornithinibacillus sp. 4-3 TaxID=3231488 RepID=A0AB39HP13_9BACI